MAKLNIQPYEEYMAMLENLSNKDMEVTITSALFEGAKIVADEIKDEMKRLQTSDNMYLGLTDIEKKDLIDGFGIASVQHRNDVYDVKIGFDGYGSKPTVRWPKGVPIPLTARALISGTSFRRKNDFVRRAVRRKKKIAIEKMNEVINENIMKEMKENG